MILAKAPEKKRELTPHEQYILGFTKEIARHVFLELIERGCLEGIEIHYECGGRE